MKKFLLITFSLGLCLVSLSLGQQALAAACAKPNTCVLATACEETTDQVTGDCPTATPQCCKPVCATCKTTAEGCTGNLTVDAASRSCGVGKICCKTTSAGTAPKSSDTTPKYTEGASIPLAPLSPVGEIDIATAIGIGIKGLLGIVGSLALIIFIYGGFIMLTSQGDTAKIKKGKDSLIWATAGLAVIFGSYIFVNYIITALSENLK
jgi:hypothetical protein